MLVILFDRPCFFAVNLEKLELTADLNIPKFRRKGCFDTC